MRLDQQFREFGFTIGYEGEVKGPLKVVSKESVLVERLGLKFKTLPIKDQPTNSDLLAIARLMGDWLHKKEEILSTRLERFDRGSSQQSGQRPSNGQRQFQQLP